MKIYINIKKIKYSILGYICVDGAVGKSNIQITQGLFRTDLKPTLLYNALMDMVIGMVSMILFINSSWLDTFRLSGKPVNTTVYAFTVYILTARYDYTFLYLYLRSFVFG